MQGVFVTMRKGQTLTTHSVEMLRGLFPAPAEEERASARIQAQDWNRVHVTAAAKRGEQVLSAVLTREMNAVEGLETQLDDAPMAVVCIEILIRVKGPHIRHQPRTETQSAFMRGCFKRRCLQAVSQLWRRM